MAVYFIQSATGEIKIGHSDNPEKRLQALQTGHPSDLRLVREISGDRSEEKGLHRRFAHLRLRGEWFRCSGSLAKYLGVGPVDRRPGRRERLKECAVCVCERPLSMYENGDSCVLCRIWAVVWPNGPDTTDKAVHNARAWKFYYLCLKQGYAVPVPQ